jgi:hypothetical protein
LDVVAARQSAQGKRLGAYRSLFKLKVSKTAAIIAPMTPDAISPE